MLMRNFCPNWTNFPPYVDTKCAFLGEIMSKFDLRPRLWTFLNVDFLKLRPFNDESQIIFKSWEH